MPEQCHQHNQAGLKAQLGKGTVKTVQNQCLAINKSPLAVLAGRVVMALRRPLDKAATVW